MGPISTNKHANILQKNFLFLLLEKKEKDNEQTKSTEYLVCTRPCVNHFHIHRFM